MGLLERAQSFNDLTAWLGAAAAHGGLVVLVEGEAGIGKTSLVQEFARTQKIAPRVLWGACDALFTPRPLGPLYDIARQVGERLNAALAAGNRDAIFSAALDELEQGAPTLVVLEDLHWADEATLDLVKFLGRRIARARACLLITYRDDELGARHPLRFVLGELPRSSVRRVHLAPLSEAAVRELASGAGRDAAALYAATAGNPFFLTEVLGTEGSEVPETVRDAVLARALRLSAPARAIAEFSSVVPERAEPWLLEEALHPQPAHIEECLGIGMVRREDGALAFRHELARRALEDSLPGSRQVALHAQILALLTVRPGIPTARLAHHADGARDAAAVLELAPRAAEQSSAVGAHREAASHYRLALQYAAGLSASARASLYEHLSYACYLTDQLESALVARRAALDIWRTLGVRLKEGDALRWLSRLAWFVGRGADAERYAAEAVAVLDALPAGPELAMAYSNRAQLEMLAGRAASAIHWAQRTIELAEPGGYVEILSHALNNLGTVRASSGDLAGYADLERSLELALKVGSHDHISRALTNLATTPVAQHSYARGFVNLQRGLEHCERYDLDSWRIYLLGWRARAYLETGQWSRASEDAEAVLAHPHTAPISRITALLVIGTLRARRGDSDAAQPLEEARVLAEPTAEPQRLVPLARALAESAWIADDHARIVSVAQPVYALAQHSADPWLKGELAVWLWRAAALSVPPEGAAEPYRLEMAGDWVAAARCWQSMGNRFEEAIVLAWHGGESERLAALTIMEDLGAGAAADALRRRLRASGMRRVPRGSRASTRQHVFGLTRREAQVLELLGEGLANTAIAARLFVSTKTVDHHVSAVLAKLGVPSRAEAGAMARRKPREDS